MTSIAKASRKTLRDSFARAVGFLLVVFILYGTTVEAAHRHGSFLPSASSTSTAFTSQETAIRTRVKVNCNDCLICQLHQNFATSLTSIKADLDPATHRFHQRGPTLDLVRSQTSTTATGRAPPQIN